MINNDKYVHSRQIKRQQEHKLINKNPFSNRIQQQLFRLDYDELQNIMSLIPDTANAFYINQNRNNYIYLKDAHERNIEILNIDISNIKINIDWFITLLGNKKIKNIKYVTIKNTTTPTNNTNNQEEIINKILSVFDIRNGLEYLEYTNITFNNYNIHSLLGIVIYSYLFNNCTFNNIHTLKLAVLNNENDSNKLVWNKLRFTYNNTVLNYYGYDYIDLEILELSFHDGNNIFINYILKNTTKVKELKLFRVDSEKTLNFNILKGCTQEFKENLRDLKPYNFKTVSNMKVLNEYNNIIPFTINISTLTEDNIEDISNLNNKINNLFICIENINIINKKQKTLGGIGGIEKLIMTKKNDDIKYYQFIYTLKDYFNENKESYVSIHIQKSPPKENIDTYLTHTDLLYNDNVKNYTDTNKESFTYGITSEKSDTIITLKFILALFKNNNTSTILKDFKCVDVKLCPSVKLSIPDTIEELDKIIKELREYCKFDTLYIYYHPNNDIKGSISSVDYTISNKKTVIYIK